MAIEHSSLFAHAEPAAVVKKVLRQIFLRDLQIEIPENTPWETVELNGSLLHLTSLTFLQILMEAEEILQINLDDELFMKAQFTTLGNLVDFITQIYVAKTEQGAE